MDTWINQNLGQIHLNPDPSHGIDGQCVNLASSWSLYQGGPELSGSTAWVIWQTFRHPFYDVFPGNAPIRGDIVFFAPNDPQIGTGSAGHVDVWVGDKGIDTNWNNNPRAQYVNHSQGIVGVFRKKETNMPTPSDKYRRDQLVGLTLPKDKWPQVNDPNWGLGPNITDLIDALDRDPNKLQILYPPLADGVQNVIINGVTYVPKTK